MIDLHIHSKYSFDGTDEVIDILKKSEELNLKYISITDHNTVDAYEELEQMDVSKYYLGEIISGIEINTKAAGIPIEIQRKIFLKYKFTFSCLCFDNIV